MPNYILSPDIALRSWQLVPHAYYRRGQRYASGLSRAEFDLLLQCDGETDIPPSPALDSLLNRRLCVMAENGEKLNDWQRHRSCPNRYFPSANWAITGKCNFNCRHCFNAADNAPINAEFSWDQCQNFIRQLDECGVQEVALTGGEPMRHPRFMDVCREIDRRGMVVSELTTNGSFITSEMLDEFAKFKCWPVFKLSLDGLGHHDWFRMREGAEKDVIAKTKMLRDRGFCVRFQTNVHKGNVDAILPTARLGAEMGVETIRVIRTSEAPRWEQMGGDLCLSIREYYDFGLNLCRLLLEEKLDIAVNIWQTFQLWPKIGAHEHVAAQGTEQGYRDSLPVCKGNRGLIAITPEGGVLPCNQMSGILKKRGVPMPSVHDVPLMELLSGGDYLKSVCYTVGEFKEENQKCRDCPHWKRCMGGCRGLGMLYGGNYYTSHDPAKCIYFDEYYDKFEALFSEKAEMAMDNA